MKTFTQKFLIPPVFVLISLILIVAFYFLFTDLKVIPFPFNFSGILIALAGFVLTGKVRDLFKKHSTTLDIKKSTRLIDEGVFKKSRNPMYLGMFMLLFGLSICFCNIISMCVPFAFIVFVGIVFVPAEEKMLEETFGRQYLDYKKRTRRWI